METLQVQIKVKEYSHRTRTNSSFCIPFKNPFNLQEVFLNLQDLNKRRYTVSD